MVPCPKRWLDQRASQSRKTGPKRSKTYVSGARDLLGLLFPLPCVQSRKGGTGETHPGGELSEGRGGEPSRAGLGGESLSPGLEVVPEPEEVSGSFPPCLL